MSCRSRHGWLKNTTCIRPVPSPTTASTIVRRLRADALARPSAPSPARAPRCRRRGRRRGPRSCGRPSGAGRCQQVEHRSRCRSGRARRACARRRPSAGDTDGVELPQRSGASVTTAADASVGVIRRRRGTGTAAGRRRAPRPRRRGGCGQPGGDRRRSSARSASTPVMTVTSSRSSSTRRSSSAVAAPTTSGATATMPSPRDEAHPVALGDRAGLAAAASRTARVTSPVDDGLGGVAHRRGVDLGASPPGRTPSSAARPSGIDRVGTTRTVLRVRASSCSATGMMFLLPGSTTT